MGKQTSKHDKLPARAQTRDKHGVHHRICTQPQWLLEFIVGHFLLLHVVISYLGAVLAHKKHITSQR